MRGSEVLPALVWLILVSRMPESPRWLVATGRIDEARETMRLVMPPVLIDEQLNVIRASMGKSQNAGNLLSQLRELLRPHARKADLVGVNGKQ